MFRLKKLRQKWQNNQSFPEGWLKIVHQNVPYYRRLPADKQQDLQKHIQKFIESKYFEGCGGLSITDEMKVTIAAQACILILGSGSEMYPGLRSVLVYSHNYFASVKQTSSGGIVTEGVQQRLGESWSYGNVVLAWDDVQAGASDEQDGRNLVFHEFAHQLDREFGATSRIGLPPEEGDDEWTKIVRNAYQSFLSDLDNGISTLIDPYGAKNPAEFFAVTTECFFEQPAKLHKKHLDLYDQFQGFYRQNPMEYFQGRCSPTEVL
jgi:Mlc titration factor MtfA (ptsG expression regulator)